MRFSIQTEQLLNEAFMHSAGLSLSDDIVHSSIGEKISAYRAQQLGIDAAGNSHPQYTGQRAGVHKMQSLLFSGGGDLEHLFGKSALATEVRLPNWELVSAIETLAECNIAIAQKFLPEKLRQLAEEWSWVDAKRQKEICEEVFLFLRRFNRRERDSSEDSVEELDLSTQWCKDYLDQHPDRIFPRKFMRDATVEPNCLGKAQILLAFFELAKAHVLGVTPVTLSEEAIHKTLVGLSSAVTQWADENDVEISEKLLARFAQRKRAAEMLERYPGRFHMAVVIQLADKSWFMIDPHMQVRGLLGNPREMNFSSQILELYNPVLPGFCSMSAEGIGVEKATFTASMAAGRIMEICKKMHADWNHFQCHPAAAIPTLAMSPALELLVEEGIGLLDGEQESYRDFIAGKKFALFGMKRGKGEKSEVVQFRTSSGQQLSPQQTMRMQVAMQILHRLGVKTAAEFMQRDQREFHARGLRKVLSMLPSFAYKHAAMALGVGKDGGSLIHPLLEIYEPRFRVGVEQVAHLNSLQEKQSNRVIMELASHCAGQHHSTLAATEALRVDGEILSEVSWSAIELLQASPILLPVAEEALLRLREVGLLYHPVVEEVEELVHV